MADVKHKLKKYKYYLASDRQLDKVMLVFNKLAMLPITIGLLQETGIGKVVNSFRKKEGEIGQKAKELVSKWKSLVQKEAVSTDIGHSGRMTTEENEHESEAEMEDNEERMYGEEQEDNNVSDDDRKYSSDSFEYRMKNNSRESSSDRNKGVSISSKEKERSHKDHAENNKDDDLSRKSSSLSKHNKLNSAKNVTHHSQHKHNVEKSSSHNSSSSSKQNLEKSRSSSSHKPISNKDSSSSLNTNHSSVKNSSHHVSGKSSSNVKSDHTSGRSSSSKSSQDKHGRAKSGHSDSSGHSTSKPKSSSKDKTSSALNSSTKSLSEKVDCGFEMEDKDELDVDMLENVPHLISSGNDKAVKHMSSHHSPEALSSSSSSSSSLHRSKQSHKTTTAHSSAKVTHIKNESSSLLSNSDVKRASSGHDKKGEKVTSSSLSGQRGNGEKSSRNSSSASHKSEDRNVKNSRHSEPGEKSKSEPKNVDLKNKKDSSLSTGHHSHHRSSSSKHHSSHSTKEGDKSSKLTSHAKDKQYSSKPLDSSAVSPSETVKKTSVIEQDMYTGIPSSDEDEITSSLSQSNPLSKKGRISHFADESVSDLFCLDGGEKIIKTKAKDSSASEKYTKHKHSGSSGQKTESSGHRSAHDKNKEKPDKTNPAINYSDSEMDLFANETQQKGKSSENKKSKNVSKRKRSKEENEMSFDDFLSYDIKIANKKSKLTNKATEKSGTLHDKFRVTKKAGGGDTAADPDKPLRVNAKCSKKDDGDFVVPVPSKPMKITENDILCYLPETQAHYRPWRFNQIEDNKLDQDLDASLFRKKSKTRSQVYSGKRQVCTEMKSLFDNCIYVLMDNIDSIESVGGIPFDILKPVLERATPVQLFSLEDNNPHFLEDTDYLWQQHCKRDFRLDQPDELESWRELYLRKFDEREAKFERLKGKMAATVSKQNSETKKVQLAYVDTVAKPPREVLRQQRMFGTATVSRYRKTDSGVTPWSHSKLPPRNSNTPERPQKVTKTIAPMMQKTMKMIRKIRR